MWCIGLICCRFFSFENFFFHFLQILSVYISVLFRQNALFPFFSRPRFSCLFSLLFHCIRFLYRFLILYIVTHSIVLLLPLSIFSNCGLRPFGHVDFMSSFLFRIHSSLLNTCLDIRINALFWLEYFLLYFDRKLNTRMTSIANRPYLVEVINSISFLYLCCPC